MSRRIMATVAALGCLALAAQATVIFQDDFESRTVGALNGQATWFSPSSPTYGVYSVADGGGLGNSIIGGGNQRITSPTGSGNASVATYATFTPTTSDRVYVRFNISTSHNNSGPFFGFRIADGNTYVSCLGIALRNGRIEARATNSGGSHVSAIGTTFQTATTYTIAFLASKTTSGGNYDQVEAWLNPSLPGETDTDLINWVDTNSGSGIMATSDTGVSQFSYIAFQKGATGTQPAIQLDSMMVAIPEPGTISVLALTGVALIVRRRMRQHAV